MEVFAPCFKLIVDTILGFYFYFYLTGHVLIWNENSDYTEIKLQFIEYLNYNFFYLPDC